LAISEDLSFHFKYFDVVRGIAQQELANQRGEVERDSFIRWFYTPIEEYKIVPL